LCGIVCAMPNHSTPSNDPAAHTWQSIERLVDEVADLSAAEIPVAEFYSQLSTRLMSALAAVSAVVWTFQDGRFVLEQQIRLGESLLAELVQNQGHLRFLDRTRLTGQADLLLPQSGATAEHSAANPTQYMLLACPVASDGETVSIVEVVQRPTTDPETQQGQLNLLAAMCEAAADFHRNERLRNLLAERAFWEQSDRFARQVHAAGSDRDVAYAIVNEGRRLLSCDRVSLAMRAGSKFRLKTVSGVERVEGRSRSVRLLEALCRQVAATGERLWYDGQAAELPPQIERALQQYVDESHVRLLVIEPLREPASDAEQAKPGVQPIHGALIVERFDAARDERLKPRLASVRAQSEIALSNALRRRGPVGRAIRWLVDSRGWVKTSLAIVAIAALAASAMLVPADFTIEARGQLQAEVVRDVFAPVDGEVSRVLVQYDEAVTTGQTLTELTSAELDLEYERLMGEKRTTQQKLLAAQSERVRSNTPSAEDRRRLATWSATEKELESQLAAIDQQLAILQRQLDLLMVASPMDGHVQTWDVKQLLQSRPVVRGQVLMTIAHVDGPWIVELEIPDHHIGHVYQAVEEAGTELDVDFILKTDPDVRYAGRLREIAARSTPQEQGDAYVRAVVAIDRDAIAQTRSGAEVVAHIHCGRAPIGYVWLHDLIDAVKTWVLF